MIFRVLILSDAMDCNREHKRSGFGRAEEEQRGKGGEGKIERNVELIY